MRGVFAVKIFVLGVGLWAGVAQQPSVRLRKAERFYSKRKVKASG